MSRYPHDYHIMYITYITCVTCVKYIKYIAYIMYMHYNRYSHADLFMKFLASEVSADHYTTIVLRLTISCSRIALNISLFIRRSPENATVFFLPPIPFPFKLDKTNLCHDFKFKEGDLQSIPLRNQMKGSAGRCGGHV